MRAGHAELLGSGLGGGILLIHTPPARSSVTIRGMKDPTRVWVWVGVVVLVAIVAAWIVWRPGLQQPAQSGPVPVYAPQGQLVPQFPKGLILDSNAAISGSYSINYSSSTNQYTAEYNSSNTMASLYTKYKAYLPANGWVITNDISEYSGSRGLYASNASSDVAVAVVSQKQGSQVTITYVVK